MTATILEFPTELTATCTGGYPWCQGECTDADPYHGGLPFGVTASRMQDSEWVDTVLTLRVRFDGNENAPLPVVLLNDSLTGFTAEQARQFAATLLDAADELEAAR